MVKGLSKVMSMFRVKLIFSHILEYYSKNMHYSPFDYLFTIYLSHIEKNYFYHATTKLYCVLFRSEMEVNANFANYTTSLTYSLTNPCAECP